MGETLIPLSDAREELALLRGRLLGERRATARLLKAIGGGTLTKAWTEAGRHRDHGRFSHADPLPADPVAPGDDDPHAALYEALLAAVTEAREAGDDDAVPQLVDAYRSHLDDPGLMTAALAGAGGGTAIEKAIGRVILKAGRWDSNKHPRSDDGRFVSKDKIQAAAADPAKAEQLRENVTDPAERKKLDAAIADQEGTVGRTKRGQQRHEAGQRREKVAANHRRAGELADKVADGSATYEELHELGDHLEGLTLDKLQALQSRIPTEGRGRRKADVVAALRASLDATRHELHGQELAVDDGKLDTLREAVKQLVGGGASDEDVTAMLGRGPGKDAVAQVLAEVRGAGQSQEQPATPAAVAAEPAPTPAAAAQLQTQQVPSEAVKPGDPNRPKVEYVRAPAGGQVSDVDGRHYAGGQLMPTHGLYSGQPKAPKGNGVGAGDPVKPNEDAEGGSRRQPAQPLTPEQIAERHERAANQKKWDEMNAGPLGRVTWLGNSPNSKGMGGGTELKRWREYAESIGPEGVKHIIDTLEPEYHRVIDDHYATRRTENQATKDAGRWNPTYDRDVNPDDEQWHKDDLKRRGEYSVGILRGGKGHEKNVPGSHYARELVHEMMNRQNHPPGTSQIDIMYRMNGVLAGKPASLEPPPREATPPRTETVAGAPATVHPPIAATPAKVAQTGRMEADGNFNAPAPAAPPAAGPKPPMPEGAPARPPRPPWFVTDAAHSAVADHYDQATGKAKEVIGTALTNAGWLDTDADGNPTRWAKKAPERSALDGGVTAKERAVSGLASGHRYLTDSGAGTPADIAHVESALAAAGAKKVGEAGQTVPFDGAVHGHRPGVFTGDPVRVTKPGWSLPVNAHGDSITPLKAEVEPTGAKAGGAARGKPGSPAAGGELPDLPTDPAYELPEIDAGPSALPDLPDPASVRPAGAAPPVSPPPPPPVVAGGAGDEGPKPRGLAKLMYSPQSRYITLQPHMLTAGEVADLTAAGLITAVTTPSGKKIKYYQVTEDPKVHAAHGLLTEREKKDAASPPPPVDPGHTLDLTRGKRAIGRSWLARLDGSSGQYGFDRTFLSQGQVPNAGDRQHRYEGLTEGVYESQGYGDNTGARLYHHVARSPGGGYADRVITEEEARQMVGYIKPAAPNRGPTESPDDPLDRMRWEQERDRYRGLSEGDDRG